MLGNIILILIVIISKMICENKCSEHCLYCKDEKKCTRCEDNYILVGTSEFSSDDEITCIPANSPFNESINFFHSSGL